MSTPFQFELASPEKLRVSKNVALATVPSEKGLYGVLAGHASMITTIKPGVVEVYENDDATVTERYFVEGGFAEVTGSRFTVLAEKAVPVSKLDRAKLETELKTIEDEAAKAVEEDEHAALEVRRDIATAKIMAME
jgi:F-type H+-transporting ATPase subunit epsilon